jgi:penicillin-binding protein 1A
MRRYHKKEQITATYRLSMPAAAVQARRILLRRPFVTFPATHFFRHYRAWSICVHWGGDRFFFALTRDLPQIQSLETYKPPAITRIYAVNGKVLAERFSEKREPVPLSVMPRYLKDAIIATEDNHFFEHPGVDVKGIARAVAKNILAGDYAEGASTITQQLAKTLFLSPRKNIMRKLKEAFLSFQIEHRYTKNEILELYLNQVYFGSGAYGVEAASRIFFGKSVQALSPAECALIAGMPKSPSRYSPLINQELAVKRRNIVLQQMQQNGRISAQEFEQSKVEPLRLTRSDGSAPKAPYFVSYVMQVLEKELGETAVYRLGLSVHTTLDERLQEIAEKAVQSGIETLAARMKAQGLLETARTPEAALICLDVAHGAIRALVGGRDYGKSHFNRATMARRQPGSAFKPLIYALAVELGFAQNDMVWDAPVVFKGADEKDWSPENYTGTYLGEITLRKALALSKNTPAVRLLNKLGASNAMAFAQKLGIFSPLEPNLSLVLGTSGVTLLELTSAYAAFPNGGVWTSPFAVSEVRDRENNILWQPKPQMRPVMGKETAAIITDMLQAVIREGTGREAKKINRPLAGKTGTTDSFKDALFVGFSPTLAVGVWVGLDDYITLGKGETGAKAALPIWIDFMEAALKGQPYFNFDTPDGVVTVPMNPDTGRLSSPNCPDAVQAVFKKGTEPKNPCP